VVPMTRTAPVVDWTNPTDPTVLAGLLLKCGMGTCRAFPGEHCRFKGKPLPTGRIVHHYRIEVDG
jgi:hypothetical protein